MRKIDKFKKVNDKNFKRVVGVKRATFEAMVQEYKKAEEKRKRGHKRGGRKPKLCEEDRVLFMLEYYREYRTLYHMGIDYGISEGQASKLVRDVESVLIKSGKFSLPSKRALYDADSEIEFIIIDATESPIERPKKKQKDHYSGKKKQHTLKAQIVIDQNHRILCVDTTNGKEHDFSLYKRSRLPILQSIEAKVDLGYIGIEKLHSNVEIPKKNTKKYKLVDEDKKANQEKASKRIFVEHVNAKIKTFQILKQKYRNRRKRYNLRVNLICGLINFDRGMMVLEK